MMPTCSREPIGQSFLTSMYPLQRLKGELRYFQPKPSRLAYDGRKVSKKYNFEFHLSFCLFPTDFGDIWKAEVALRGFMWWITVMDVWQRPRTHFIQHVGSESEPHEQIRDRLTRYVELKISVSAAFTEATSARLHSTNLICGFMLGLHHHAPQRPLVHYVGNNHAKGSGWGLLFIRGRDMSETWICKVLRVFSSTRGAFWSSNPNKLIAAPWGQRRWKTLPWYFMRDVLYWWFSRIFNIFKLK